MAFTTVTLTGTYRDAQGNAAAGSLTFTLTAAMVNADQLVPPTPIQVFLDSNGAFSVALYANDDTATVPSNVQYGVTEQVANGQPRDYFITLSHLVSPVDISTLMPGDPGWN